MKFFKRLVTALSDRADYEAAISAIEEAIRSGKLSPQDKRQKATEFVEPKGWPIYCWFSNPKLTKVIRAVAGGYRPLRIERSSFSRGQAEERRLRRRVVV